MIAGLSGAATGQSLDQASLGAWPRRGSYLDVASYNHLAGRDPTQFRNSYFLVRDCPSEARSSGIVDANRKCPVVDRGLLSEAGLSLARKSAVDLYRGHETAFSTRPTIILHSEMPRAEQTAEVFREVLSLNAGVNTSRRDIAVRACRELGERWAGDFNGLSESEFRQHVWEADRANPFNSNRHVEMPVTILQRMTLLVATVEEKLANHNIIIVSHLDPLRILLTGIRGICPSSHSELEMIEPGRFVSI